MKYLKYYKWVFIAMATLMMSFSAVHKFYLSVSEISYSESDQKIRIISRIFIDDLDAVLLARYEIESKLSTADEHEMAGYYLEKYIKAKFLIKANDTLLDYEILGHKIDNDQMVFFMEATYEDIQGLNSLFVQNELLMDKFDEQQNIVHLQLKGIKKSVMLIKERSSSMLNF